ncbi:MAG: methyltransferase domain-containing protein [Candidatus Magasanikbacteria bacterium]
MRNNLPPFKVLLKGLATFIPGTYRLFCKGTGGTISARYCYSVWLRHLILAQNTDIPYIPKVVAEIGPGDSIGIGLAALLSGADKYFALDAFKHINSRRNIKIFDELVELFRKRERIPDERECPNIYPTLKNYDFPYQILSDELLGGFLEPGRIDSIRSELVGSNHSKGFINYFAPWYNPAVIKENSVDFIYSQFVLEHVDELELTYQAMRCWLKPQGLMSHMIDFRCHGTALDYNGHWAFSDFVWRLVKGGRPFLLNRQPLSTHLSFFKKFNFMIVDLLKYQSEPGIDHQQLSARFRNLDEQDLKTWGVFVRAQKV